ncbi:hypothetical protein PENTCL1PPCAC_27070, partial [Pristionchus entomophagus]
IHSRKCNWKKSRRRHTTCGLHCTSSRMCMANREKIVPCTCNDLPPHTPFSQSVSLRPCTCTLPRWN